MSDLLVADKFGAVVGNASTYRKAPEPKLGEKFGLWAGRDEAVQLMKLPGGGLLMFDLDRLTLEDFRSMRNHYQVHISLMILTFLMHQTDWTIESDDARVQQHCEENLREIWTRLIRGMSQAFWAGYSPMVLQYENDVAGRKVMIDKVKDLIPEECRVNWKKVEGYAPVGSATPKLNVFDGIKQQGTSWPIPVENSLWYPLLMENGDYYGRKLLKPAFPPWFFSQLIHLFANRYFERFGEPVPIGRAPVEDNIVINGVAQTGHQVMEGVLRNLRNRSVVVLPNDRDPTVNATRNWEWDIEYLECAALDTEILTRDGWKMHDQLKVGDEAFTLNHDTGLAEWQPVQKVNVYSAAPRQMLAMEGTTHSSLTTMGHRWPVLHRNWRKGTEARVWRESGEIQQRDRIPLIAPQATFPVEPKYDDALVELVAWYWTEGCTLRERWVQITQKRYPERIRAALTRLFGPDSSPRIRDGLPRWRERVRNDGVVTFMLNEQASDVLQSVAPDRIVRNEFMLALTQAQLALYIDAALAADGNVTARQSLLMQTDRRKAEQFQFACILAGHATSLYESKADERWKDRPTMWTVSIRRQQYLDPRNAHAGSGPFTMSIIDTNESVWCPTTPNGTWLARRRGTVYFTGNSQMRGADFERYLQRLDEEISLALFTPVLLYRTADVGSYNLGEAHYRLFMSMLNALAGDMKEYIDRYVLDRMVDFNFSPNAPRARWHPRKLGKDTSEILRAMASSLITQKIAMPDLDELGVAIGMPFQEIQEVKAEVNKAQLDAEIAAEAAERNAELRPDPVVVPAGAARGGNAANNAAQVAAKMFKRAKLQVERGFRDGQLPESLDLGHRRQLLDFAVEQDVDRMLDRFDHWYRDIHELGLQADEVIGMIEKVLKAELASL